MLSFTRCVKIPNRLAIDTQLVCPFDTDRFFVVIQNETILIVSTLGLADCSPDTQLSDVSWLVATLNLTEVDAQWRESEHKPHARPTRKTYKPTNRNVAAITKIKKRCKHGIIPDHYVEIIDSISTSTRKRKSQELSESPVVLPDLTLPSVKRRRRSLDDMELLNDEIDVSEPEESTTQSNRPAPVWNPIDVTGARRSSTRAGLTNFLDRTTLRDILSSSAARKFQDGKIGPRYGGSKWPILLSTGCGDVIHTVLEWDCLDPSNPQPLPIFNLLSMNLYELLMRDEDPNVLIDLRKRKSGGPQPGLFDVFKPEVKVKTPLVTYPQGLILREVIGLVVWTDTVFVWRLAKNSNDPCELLAAIVLPLGDDWTKSVTRLDMIIYQSSTTEVHTAIIAGTSHGRVVVVQASFKPSRKRKSSQSLTCSVGNVFDLFDSVESMESEGAHGPSLDSSEAVTHIQVLEKVSLHDGREIVSVASPTDVIDQAMIAVMKGSALYTFDVDFLKTSSQLMTLTTHIGPVPLCPVGLVFHLDPSGHLAAILVNVDCTIYHSTLGEDAVWLASTGQQSTSLPTQTVLLPWSECKGAGGLEWEQTATVPASQRRSVTQFTRCHSVKHLGPCLVVGSNAFHLYSDLMVALNPTSPVVHILVLTLSHIRSSSPTSSANFLESLRLASRGRMRPPAQLPDILVRPAEILNSKASSPIKIQPPVTPLNFQSFQNAVMGETEEHDLVLQWTSALEVTFGDLKNVEDACGWEVDDLKRIGGALIFAICKLNLQNDKMNVDSDLMSSLVKCACIAMLDAMVRGWEQLGSATSKEHVQGAISLMLSVINLGYRLRGMLPPTVSPDASLQSSDDTQQKVFLVDEGAIELDSTLSRAFVKIVSKAFSLKNVRCQCNLPVKPTSEEIMFAEQDSKCNSILPVGPDCVKTLECRVCCVSIGLGQLPWVDILTSDNLRCPFCGGIAELIK